jgi:HAD superfamily hydrolase (TIGR01450 family)
MFDVDGTLLLSNPALGDYEVLPGAIEVLSALRQRGVPFVLLTNGSAYPPAEQAAKLRAVGLPVEDAQMLTPSSIAADLMVRHGIGRVLVLGSPGVGHALRVAGIETVHTGDAGATQVGGVFVGWHPECGMKDIEAACRAIWGGARLYVASDVPFFASKQGRVIGYSHAITAAIRRLTHAPMVLTGKPSVHALRFVARQLGVPMRQLAVVGDDPLVEVLMARRAGATALAVTTGTTQRAEWGRQVLARRPHGILKDLRQVLEWLPEPQAQSAGARRRAPALPPRGKRKRPSAVRSRTASQQGRGRRRQ